MKNHQIDKKIFIKKKKIKMNPKINFKLQKYK